MTFHRGWASSQLAPLPLGNNPPQLQTITRCNANSAETGARSVAPRVYEREGTAGNDIGTNVDEVSRGREDRRPPDRTEPYEWKHQERILRSHRNRFTIRSMKLESQRYGSLSFSSSLITVIYAIAPDRRAK